MAKRMFDIGCAVVGLVLSAPVLAVAALGIRLTDGGPVLYRARRVGRDGRTFTMYKLRTMRESGPGPRITGPDDTRVFRWGRFLRRLRIDELPQLVNVLRGDMSIVGPRPEDPAFVACHYAPIHRETLMVRPGLTSPGTIYGCITDGLLTGEDPESLYVERMLPTKLALDLVYVRHRTFAQDLLLIARTIQLIAAGAVGRRPRMRPSELARARPLTVPARVAPVRRSSELVLLLLVLSVFGCRIDAGSGIDDRPDDDPVPQTAYAIAAGDIASCTSNRDEATAALLDDLDGTIITMGDNAYPDGTAQDFAQCYHPTWGRHLDRTRPAPGNHEYHTPDAAGYFGYFGSRAGEAGKGYYSFELGDWHVIALNSQLPMDAGSAQLQWLRADLAASDARCTLAYWHHPRFSSGEEHGGSTRSAAVWDALYEAGAEIVLAGHEHNYERFAPQDPSARADPSQGIRQFVVGTGGGRAEYGFGPPVANSEVRSDQTAGVLYLELRTDGYSWQFLPIAGETFTDSGSGTCHDAPTASAAAGRGHGSGTLAAVRRMLEVR